MIDHFDLKVKSRARAKDFYLAALAPLGYKQLATNGDDVCIGDKTSYFWLGEGEPSPYHFAFTAQSNEEVDAFYKAAMTNGARDNGGPGFRKNYSEKYYAAFVIDPDGYRIEAVCGNDKI